MPPANQDVISGAKSDNFCHNHSMFCYHRNAYYFIFLSDLAKSILDFSGRAIKQEMKYGIWNIKTFGVGLMIAAGTTVLTSAFVPNHK